MAKAKAPVAHIEQPAEQPQENVAKEPEVTVESAVPESPAAAAKDKPVEAPKKAPAAAKPVEKKSEKVRTTVVAEPEVEEKVAADARPASAAAADPTPKSASPTDAAFVPPAPRGPFAWLAKAFPGHQNAVLGGLCGLVVAMLFFAIGFWKTLFVCLLVFIGITVGQCLDGDPKILNFLRKLIFESRGEN